MSSGLSSFFLLLSGCSAVLMGICVFFWEGCLVLVVGMLFGSHEGEGGIG